MTEAAKAFEEYIKKENITGFQIREPGDERQTTVFESELEIERRRLPILVIIDATAYATVRIRLAQNAVDDTNAMLLTGWLDPDVMGSVLRVFVRDITALMPELIQLLPEAE